MLEESCALLRRSVVVAALGVWLTPGVAAQDSAKSTQTRVQLDAVTSSVAILEAERLAREDFDRLQRESPGRLQDIADARDLLVERSTAAGHAASADLLSLATEAVEIRSRLDGPDGLPTSRALHNLGELHYQRGEYEKAQRLHNDALGIRRRLLGPNDPAIADSLERLAQVLMRTEQFQSARSNLEQALAIRQPREKETPAAFARTLELSAWSHRYAGSFDLARQALDRSRAIRESEARDAIEPVTSIQLRGDLLMLDGAVAGAHTAWQGGRQAAMERLGSDHPLVAALERRLAVADAATGNRKESVEHLTNGLRIAEANMAPCDPERMALTDYSASSAMYEGEFIEARTKYQAVLQSCRTCLGENHANTATVTSNLASLAVYMGDLREAERLDRRAIAIWSQIRPDHPFIAQGLDDLAEVVAAQGRLESARVLYTRALRIRRATNKDHPYVAWTLTNLARIAAESGNVSLAVRYLDEAMAIYERAGSGADPDHVTRTLLLKGELLVQRGSYDAAHDTLTDALAARERFFGPRHPLTADARARLARLDWAKGATETALDGSLAAEDVGREHVRSTVRYLPERHALDYAASRPEGLSIALSIAAQGTPASISRIFDSLIRSRSVILDELGARRPSNADPRVASSSVLLNAKRQRFANLMLRSLEGNADATSNKLLDEAAYEREEAERTLATESVELRSELSRRAIGLTEVRQALPQRTALIAFVRYQRAIRTPLRPKAGQSKPAPEQSRLQVVPSYLAFVLPSGEVDASVISFGSADAIDSAIQRWRQAMLVDVGLRTAGADAQSFRAEGINLRRLLWDRLAPHLSQADRVFIVPDGDLNLVPFAALPVGATSYLLERGPAIHYVSAERDLVTLSDGRQQPGAGLLAFGGPSFSSAPVRNAASPPAALRAARTDGTSDPVVRGSALSQCQPFQALQFRELPATLREAQAVARLWRQAMDAPTSAPSDMLLFGREATETAFKQRGPGRRIIHLATHGFVLDNECDNAISGLRGVGGLTPVRSPTVSQRSPVDNPLLFSGLALAGANRRLSVQDENDDGILTADEVAAINLEGVEWAVLSACDTGLGEIRGGEGVFGLRRAFQVAGVRTVVMSLWGVEDRSTQTWMERLYKARLVDHLDTAESVREASLSFIRERRAKGLSTHPFYWAGFVAAGDWH